MLFLGGETPMPFNKDQLTALIEGGGGRVLKKLTPTQVCVCVCVCVSMQESVCVYVCVSVCM